MYYCHLGEKLKKFVTPPSLHTIAITGEVIAGLRGGEITESQTISQLLVASHQHPSCLHKLLHEDHHHGRRKSTLIISNFTL
jgi:hypothetical protein